MPIPFPFLGLDFRPVIDVRERFERRVDRYFGAALRDNNSDLLSRYRVGASVGKGSVKGEVVYQYAHDESWNLSQNRALWRSDVLLAHVDTPAPGGRLTLGRQRIHVANGRLLGASEWNNVTNSWDGLRYAAPRFDLFAVKMGVNPLPNQEVRLYGGTLRNGPWTTLLVYKHDGRGTGVDEATLSQNARLSLGRLGIEGEAAVQAGHRGGRRKLAGAADFIATYSVTHRYSLGLQGSVASGGGDAGTTHTFDPLYNAAHDRHGLLDLATWSNIRDLGAWVQFAPDSQTGIKLQYHRLGLDSARDAWYGSNGRPYGGFSDPTGKRGRDLGQEFDLDALRRLNRHQTLQAGLGIFRPGRFPRSFAHSPKDQFFGYLQWQYRF